MQQFSEFLVQILYRNSIHDSFKYSILLSKYLKNQQHDICCGYGVVPSLKTFFTHFWVDYNTKQYTCGLPLDFEIKLMENYPIGYQNLAQGNEIQQDLDLRAHFYRMKSNGDMVNVMLNGMKNDPELGKTWRSIFTELQLKSQELGSFVNYLE